MKKLVDLLVGDFILSILALGLGFFLRFGSLPENEGIFSLTVKFFIFGFILIISSFFLEMYSQEKNNGKKEIILRMFIGILISFFLLSSLYYMIPLIELGRGLLIISLFSFALLQFLWHFSYRAIKFSGFIRRVLILGTGPLAQKIGKTIKSKNNGYVLAGYMKLMDEPVCVPSNFILTTNNGWVDIVKEKKTHKIVVSLSERRGVLPLQDVLKCKLSGVEVIEAPSFYEEITGKLLIEDTTPSWFIFSDGFRVTPFKLFCKRALDILTASIGLILFLPLIPVIALFIKIDSPGPIFFKQLRVGEREKGFTLYKFRTMFQDAEKRTGPAWAREHDPRITRFGRFLRKIRFDEIPQLYNVLLGNMSIVGPRPERPEFVEELKKIIPYYSERHFVTPGITGWAQIRYRYGASVEDAIEKLRYDLYYIKHFSTFFDIMIIMETIKIVFLGRGAR
jgi:sugar transferase (PEP-CTERM system associated)